MGFKINKQHLITVALIYIVAVLGYSAFAQTIQAESFRNPARTGTYNLPTITGTDQVLTVSATQTVRNKDFDGGTASNSNRLTLPKATKTTLNGLTREEATITYASDEDKVYVDTGSAISALAFDAGTKLVTYQSISTSQTITVDYDVYAVSATTGNITLTLPSLASSLGKVFNIKKTDTSANLVIIDGNSTEQVEGGNDFRLYNPNDTVKIANIGTSWVVISANVQKEAASFNGGTSTVSCTANTWVTAPLTITSDSTRYPLSSNTFTIRKTARYCFTVATDFGANAEAVYVGYSVNGGSDTYLTEHAMDANASGSRSQFSETSCRSFTAGDVLRLRVRVNSNTRTCQAHMFSIWEM